MRLTSWEEERLLIFTAAELARRHRDRGLPLNAPEVIALICDEMLEAARAGATYADVERAGREAVSPDQALPGVAALVGEVRLEVLMEDGVRLVVLLEPLGPAGDDAPGAIHQAPPPGSDAPGDPPGSDAPGDPPDRSDPAALPDRRDPGDPPDTDTRDRLEIEVQNTSTRVVRVTSHYPFERTNQRLIFDREAARGFRLDLPAGSSERWAPGETRTVSLVRARSRAQNA